MNKIILLLLCCLSFFVGYSLKKERPKVEYNTITQVKVDTIVKYYPSPYLVTYLDTIHITDTILIREVKEYKDSTYYVRLSGFDANLEEIKVYNTTTERIKVKKWGIGITAGAAVHSGGISPAICVGLTYNIW